MNNIRVYIATLLLVILTGCGAPPVLSELFPEQIGGMKLEKMITGEGAIASVDKLHGKMIEAEDAVIALYMGTDTATVWISRATSGAAAREQSAMMVEKMVRTPGSPFSGHERTYAQGAEVHRFEGMGQVHLVFMRGELVYWLSTDLGAEGEVLDAFLNVD